jgi:hypothetical protein
MAPSYISITAHGKDYLIQNIPDTHAIKTTGMKQVSFTQLTAARTAAANSACHKSP